MNGVPFPLGFAVAICEEPGISSSSSAPDSPLSDIISRLMLGIPCVTGAIETLGVIIKPPGRPLAAAAAAAAATDTGLVLRLVPALDIPRGPTEPEVFLETRTISYNFLVGLNLPLLAPDEFAPSFKSTVFGTWLWLAFGDLPLQVLTLTLGLMEVTDDPEVPGICFRIELLPWRREITRDWVLLF